PRGNGDSRTRATVLRAGRRSVALSARPGSPAGAPPGPPDGARTSENRRRLLKYGSAHAEGGLRTPMFVTRMPVSTEPARKSGRDTLPATPAARPREWRRTQPVRGPNAQDALRTGSEAAARPRAGRG